MSNFEIALIILAALIPVIALFMVLPKIKIKFKKKEKKVEPLKTLVDIKSEESKEEHKIEEKQSEVKNYNVTNDISTDEFKAYLNRRKEISRPKRIDLPQGFIDRTMPYSRRRNKPQKPKTIAEEIQNLSPQAKALIISGALDRKYFDNN